MGNIISAIVTGLGELVRAIADVVLAIFSAIGGVLIAIWNFITCGCCSGGTRGGGVGTI